ncbi:ubiquinol-cytochrome c reductase iron-sulfur subunit [Natronospira bacteriovora]|uniref:Ubiquinol-cytochrome c reductase iron-sulfur subunit n=1 Tax=Natronospira bacteriovora TaxID=3069753 RepID=A0ABU0W695_9GAMM|nr:ubiquinol-cytochrome c reductase iron-sulfur subunit [Natronospira sp. AB-CW4]MDQ2069526.1 ubiquinol-cytochrome c reductase iron-sulfur subunit [Natronospira sp. AB-CW4]
MSNGVDNNRRHFLTVATSVVGGIGVAAVATPFIASLQPSAKARLAGAPVEVDVSRMDEGERITLSWRGRPIQVVRRSEDAVARLSDIRDRLRDPDSEASDQPDYARNEHRSIKPEYLVLVAVCTHLGCSPAFHPNPGDPAMGSDWPGGYFCACHGSRFDLAGRVYRNVPAPTNMEIPPHRFVDDNTLIVGEDTEVA